MWWEKQWHWQDKVSRLGSTWNQIFRIPFTVGFWVRVAQRPLCTFWRWQWSSSHFSQKVIHGDRWTPKCQWVLGWPYFPLYPSYSDQEWPQNLGINPQKQQCYRLLHGSPFQALFSGWLSSAPWTSLSAPACPRVPMDWLKHQFLWFSDSSFQTFTLPAPPIFEYSLIHLINSYLHTI